VAQAVLTFLIIRNYIGIGGTRVGRLLLVVSLALLAGSLFAATTYYIWDAMGMDTVVAIPSLVITTINFLVTLTLYMVSRL
jgi:hypothetical protein